MVEHCKLLSGFSDTDLDLPALRSCPPFAELDKVLASLELAPARWDVEEDEPQDAGFARYLTSIVSSPLAWLEGDEREALWDAASQRLAERSGRSGRGSFSRSFAITPDLTISLYEPGLTGDDLGHKTWGSAYVVARKLPEILSILPAKKHTVLELGSGTGLAGIAIAALLEKSHCVLTDLASIVPNLSHNISLNRSVTHGNVDSAVLDWSDLGQTPLAGQTFELIVSTDGLYSASHPALLAGAITSFLERTPQARLLVALPLRDGYAAIREEFLALLAREMQCLHSQTDEGRDDWGAGAVHWGIWTWRVSDL